MIVLLNDRYSKGTEVGDIFDDCIAEFIDEYEYEYEMSMNSKVLKIFI